MSWELGQPARDPYQSYTPFSYCFFVTSWKSRRGFPAFGSALTSFSGSPPSVCSKHSRLLFGSSTELHLSFFITISVTGTANSDLWEVSLGLPCPPKRKENREALARIFIFSLRPAPAG
ncbi:hypothetical protein ACOSQ2_023994 [Xanthoceras sorbifolium]